VQAYQNVPRTAPESDLRLLEVLAVTIHNLAVSLFKECHPEGGPYPDNREEDSMPDLQHPDYDNCLDYPQEAADMVGYFAETIVFGGVILFDRGESENEVDTTAPYFCSTQMSC
jgi:hypothetical protein